MAKKTKKKKEKTSGFKVSVLEIWIKAKSNGLSSYKRIKKKFKKKVLRQPSVWEIKSRGNFAKQIARTIIANTSLVEREGSFILGISGKWGEGKTRLLKRIQKELKSNYKFVWISPWEYGSDQTAFLRNFLKQLEKELKPKNRIEKIWCDIKYKNRLNRLYFDINQQKINWKYFFGLIAFLFLLLGIYLFLYFPYFQPYVKYFIPESDDPTNKVSYLIVYLVLISPIVLPILIGLFEKVSVTQRSSKSISTIDQFKDLLKEILDSSKDQKIIVCVDDLDRVTPQMSKTVLDYLRVFFDQPQLSFIVTGDHTVLERYLGLQTLPTGKPEEQLEEGKRYLKKMFDLYWRIPIPIAAELQTFLDRQISIRKTDLNAIFNEDQIKIFRLYLDTYFERNFRHIIRFIDVVIFTFNLISAQKEDSEDTEKEYFEEMLQHPLLVVRVLMLQELASPLFEEIIKDNEILYNLEFAVDQNNTDLIKTIVDPLELTTLQQIFINKFIFDKPRFFEDANLRVSSLNAFLNLAADASFGDARGPSPEAFISKVEAGDINQVKSSLIASGPQKLSSGAEAFSGLISRTTENTQKNSYFTSLFAAVSDIPIDHKSHEIFMPVIKSIDISYLSGMELADKTSVYRSYWHWLDLQEKANVSVQDYVSMFPFENLNDFTILDDDHDGWFSAKVICSWLIKYYRDNNADRLEVVNSHLDRLVPDDVKEDIEGLVGELVEEFISNTDENHRHRIYLILVDYTNSGIEKLKERVLSEVKNKNENVWVWVAVKENSEKILVERTDLEQKICDNLADPLDKDGMVELVKYGNGKLSILKDNFWEKLISAHLDSIVLAAPELAVAGLDASYSPDQIQAKKLFNAVVVKLLLSSEMSERIGLVNSLKQNWLWSNIETGFPEASKLVKLYREEADEGLRNTLLELFNSWNYPLPNEN